MEKNETETKEKLFWVAMVENKYSISKRKLTWLEEFFYNTTLPHDIVLFQQYSSNYLRYFDFIPYYQILFVAFSACLVTLKLMLKKLS